MRHRLKYMRNAPDGNGSLARGDMYQVPIKGLLGGITGHRLWETKTTAQYSIGTRLVTEDGRVFRYCLSSGAVTAGKGANSKGNLADDGIAASAVLARAVGDTQIDFDSQTFAKDELVGGYLVIHTSEVQNRYIIGNTVAANANVVITVAEPFSTLFAASQYAEVCPNPYRFVAAPSGDSANRSSILGIPFVSIAASGSYFWLQTWGPCWINPGPYGMGGQPGERSVLFNPDGSLRRMAEWGVISDWQHAGFILQSDPGGTDGPPFIMLQVSP